MKRVGYLYERIADYDNWLKAFHAAARGKHRRPEVQAFRDNLHAEIGCLQADWLSESASLGDYHYFIIHDPKQRCICAASFRERVLHHAVINKAGPVLERPLIDHSFACRKGKGQYRAACTAQAFARRRPFFLKMDVRKYFDSIDHLILYGQLEDLFKDRALLQFFQRLLGTYATGSHKGLPIGNLTSQYFANLYLNPFDHFVKQTLRCRCYVRYMDDLILWGTRAEVRDWRDQAIAFLKDHLALTVKAGGWINRSNHGCDFLGFRVFPHVLRLSARSKRRFRRQFIHLEQTLHRGRLGEDEYQERMTALCAFAAQADSRAYRQKLIREYCHDD